MFHSTANYAHDLEKTYQEKKHTKARTTQQSARGPSSHVLSIASSTYLGRVLFGSSKLFMCPPRIFTVHHKKIILVD
jgi:hypothetical protein